MGEKTVTLSAYTAERLEEYRALYARYEELAADNPSDKSDSELIAAALFEAIESMREFIAAKENRNAGTGVTS